MTKHAPSAPATARRTACRRGRGRGGSRGRSGRRRAITTKSPAASAHVAAGGEIGQAPSAGGRTRRCRGGRHSARSSAGRAAMPSAASLKNAMSPSGWVIAAQPVRAWRRSRSRQRGAAASRPHCLPGHSACSSVHEVEQVLERRSRGTSGCARSGRRRAGSARRARARRCADRCASQPCGLVAVEEQRRRRRAPCALANRWLPSRWYSSRRCSQRACTARLCSQRGRQRRARRAPT